MDRSSEHSRTRPPAWLQPGGLTLLIAVSVLASASTSLEHARRVADTSVRLVHALSASPAESWAGEPEGQAVQPGWRYAAAFTFVAVPFADRGLSVAVRAGTLDLPPPSIA